MFLFVLQELPRFQELIFEDFSRFLPVENLFEEVVLQSVSKDIMMGEEECKRLHHFFVTLHFKPFREEKKIRSIPTVVNIRNRSSLIPVLGISIDISVKNSSSTSKILVSCKLILHH